MEYKLQIPLNFHQLLDLVLQLPRPAQKRLIVALENQHQVLPKIQMKTVAQIKDKDYQYPNKQAQKLIGLWEDDTEMVYFFNQK